MTLFSLIPDKIPEIIESQGKRCKVEVMGDDVFAIYLKKKLLEEVDEFMESDEIDELVDIYEVPLAMVEFKGVEVEEFERMRKEKAEARGRFEGRLRLKEVLEKMVIP